MKIKKNEVFGFGLDYLEVIGTSKSIEDIKFKLVIDNYIESPLFPGYKIKKVLKVMNYEYKVVLQKDGFDCFAYHKGQTNGNIETYDFISIYGTAFKVFNATDEIINFILDNVDYKGLRRLDIAMDVSEDIKKVYSNFPKHDGKGSVFYDETGEVQTFYIGEKRKAQNKRKLIRCYNKIDDIKRTKRQILYPEYLTQDYVTRIEIEFRSEMCKDIDILSLLNNEYLFNLFLTYITPHTKIFSKMKFSEELLKSLQKRISIEDLRYDEIYRQRYVNTFWGYGKTILEIGGCPVDILIRKGAISEDTMKDIVLSIKDGAFRQDIYEFGLGVRNSRYIFRDPDDSVKYLSQNDFYEGGDKL